MKIAIDFAQTPSQNLGQHFIKSRLQKLQFSPWIYVVKNQQHRTIKVASSSRLSIYFARRVHFSVHL